MMNIDLNPYQGKGMQDSSVPFKHLVPQIYHTNLQNFNKDQTNKINFLLVTLMFQTIIPVDRQWY